MGKKKGSSNHFSANKMSINPDVDNIVQRFRDLESYGTTEIINDRRRTCSSQMASNQHSCI